MQMYAPVVSFALILFILSLVFYDKQNDEYMYVCIFRTSSTICHLARSRKNSSFSLVLFLNQTRTNTKNLECLYVVWL
jgi:hypothetical protein